MRGTPKAAARGVGKHHGGGKCLLLCVSTAVVTAVLLLGEGFTHSNGGYNLTVRRLEEGSEAGPNSSEAGLRMKSQAEAGGGSQGAAAVAVQTARQPTIFVGVASFRDSDCSSTLKSMLEEAEFPARVFVGLLDQLDVRQPQEHCHWPDDDWARTNLRIIKMSEDQSRGPVTARYLTSMLFRNEDFYFQIDSHMRFEPRWDSKVVEMWRERQQLLSTHKFILSHYPMQYDNNTGALPEDRDRVVPAHCVGWFNDDGIWQPRDFGLPVQDVPKTRPVAVAAAGMAFAHGQLLHDVPFDPYLPHLFHGEELLYGIRCHAAGWKVYTPSSNIVYHFYVRAGKPKSWESFPDTYHQVQLLSLMRVRRAISLEPVQDSDPPQVRYQLDAFSVSHDSFTAWQQEFGVDYASKASTGNACA